MIRFRCPICQVVIEAQPAQVGTKLPCPRCGQRLQVPRPLPNKTVLGEPLPQLGGRATELYVPGLASVEESPEVLPAGRPEEGWTPTAKILLGLSIGGGFLLLVLGAIAAYVWYVASWIFEHY